MCTQTSHAEDVRLTGDLRDESRWDCCHRQGDECCEGRAVRHAVAVYTGIHKHIEPLGQDSQTVALNVA